MDGSHVETLNYVEMADVPHVDKMLARLDEYARSDGKSMPGDFLTALIIGDLFRAAFYADDVNKKYLYLFAKYLHNDVPGTHVDLARAPLAAIRKAAGKHVVLTRAMVDDTTREFETRLQDLTKG